MKSPARMPGFYFKHYFYFSLREKLNFHVDPLYISFVF